MKIKDFSLSLFCHTVFCHKTKNKEERKTDEGRSRSKTITKTGGN